MEDQDKTGQPADQNPPPMNEGSAPPPPMMSESAGMPPPPPPPPVEVVAPAMSIPNYAAPTPATETNTLAIVSLIASISGWVIFFGIGGVVGVICGIIARGQIKSSMGRQTGDGLALGGIIVGAVNIALICIILLCVGVTFIGAGISSNSR